MRRGEKIIKLKQQKITYVPKEYYIAGVVDDRADTASIGMLKTGFSGKLVKVVLQDGVTAGLTQFINRNVSRDTTNTPIWLHVSKLIISEKMVNAIQQADVDVVFAFYYKDQKLVEYTGSGYQRSAFDVSGYVGTLIRQTLESSITQFDKWLSENKTTALAPASITVKAVIVDKTDDTELIPYSKTLRLVADDFQAEPDDLSFAAAATYSGINVSSAIQSLGNQLTMTVSVSVYFDKSKSWCKPFGRNAKTLAHEQLHFDITAIKACEFIEAIRNYTFSIDNYQKELEQLHKQKQKEITQLQNDYDKETKHGTIVALQQQWEKKIKGQLAEQKCY